MTARPVWNVKRLPKDSLEGRQWAYDQGLVPAQRICRRKGHGACTLIEEDTFGRFRCNRCRKEKGRTHQWAATAGTWFEYVKLPPDHVAFIMYGFAEDWQYDVTRREAWDVVNPNAPPASFSQHTLTNWYRCCREMVVDHFSRNQNWKEQIGGPGIVIEINDSMFGHRIYERGHINTGNWALGMIASSSNDVRLVVVERRDGETVIPEILKHVAPGSIIYTDDWQGYISLSQYRYEHHVVTHSDPMHRLVALDHAPTKKFAMTWRPAKDFFRNRPRYNDEPFADHLGEYLWRRYCARNNEDRFEYLLEAVRAMYGLLSNEGLLKRGESDADRLRVVLSGQQFNWLNDQQFRLRFDTKT